LFLGEARGKDERKAGKGSEPTSAALISCSLVTDKTNVTKEVEAVDEQWASLKRVVAGISDRPVAAASRRAAEFGMSHYQLSSGAFLPMTFTVCPSHWVLHDLG